MAVELSKLILRHSISALSSHRGADCDKCRRTPVPGEFLHLFEDGRALCALCIEKLPRKRRTHLRAERVHASDRPLSVGPHRT
ncbi:MAG: hypothetical protein H0V29_12890 [Thermoleophilaceae bacterium]|nr:hypothetical protein [Thermoleophilaceae bacterium]